MTSVDTSRELSRAGASIFWLRACGMEYVTVRLEVLSINEQRQTASVVGVGPDRDRIPPQHISVRDFSNASWFTILNGVRPLMDISVKVRARGLRIAA